ncbi:hypothetical protein HK101_009802 [Irineochytrium annulatum]|nr:hypothetical protein HK101_009802 [Irineochytrium annulatum]
MYVIADSPEFVPWGIFGHGHVRDLFLVGRPIAELVKKDLEAADQAMERLFFFHQTEVQTDFVVERMMLSFCSAEDLDKLTTASNNVDVEERLHFVLNEVLEENNLLNEE